MSEVEQPDCCKFYCKQFYEEKILILLIRKKLELATAGQNQSEGPYDGLVSN